jgi:hypothetical protein
VIRSAAALYQGAAAVLPVLDVTDSGHGCGWHLGRVIRYTSCTPLGSRSQPGDDEVGGDHNQQRCRNSHTHAHSNANLGTLAQACRAGQGGSGAGASQVPGAGVERSRQWCAGHRHSSRDSLDWLKLMGMYQDETVRSRSSRVGAAPGPARLRCHVWKAAYGPGCSGVYAHTMEPCTARHTARCPPDQTATLHISVTTCR